MANPYLEGVVEETSSNPYLSGTTSQSTSTNPYLEGLGGTTTPKESKPTPTETSTNWAGTGPEMTTEEYFKSGYEGRFATQALRGDSDLMAKADETVKKQLGPDYQKDPAKFQEMFTQEYRRLVGERDKAAKEERAKNPEPTFSQSMQEFGKQLVTSPWQTAKSMVYELGKDPLFLLGAPGMVPKVTEAAATVGRAAKVGKVAAKVGKTAAKAGTIGAVAETAAEAGEPGGLDKQRILNTVGNFAVLGATTHAGLSLIKGGASKLGKSMFDYNSLVDKLEANLKKKGIDLKEEEPTSTTSSTYGESLGPLDKQEVLKHLSEVERLDPDVHDFIELTDKVNRAEKVSDPSTWTDQERAAYESGDWKEFSKLRGYTEEEITNYDNLLKVQQRLQERYGAKNPDYTASLDFLIKENTPDFNLTPDEGSVVADLFKDLNEKTPDKAVLKTVKEIKANSRMASVWRRTIESLVKDPVTRERITMAMEKEKDYDKILTDAEKESTIQSLSQASERLKQKTNFKTEEEANNHAERIKRIDYVVEKLKSLPSEEYAKPIMDHIQKVYADIAKAAKKQGVLNRLVTNYVNHALNFAESKLKEPERQSLIDMVFKENSDKFVRDFSLERQFRFIRDLEKAIYDAGAKLNIDVSGVKVERDIAKLAEMYMKAMGTAVLEQRLLNHLETIKVPGVDKELVPLVTKNSDIAFRNGYEQFKGKEVGRSKGYAVHPDIVPVLKFLWDYKKPNMVLKAISGIAALGKILNTSASLFHLKSLGEVRLLNEPVSTLVDAFSGFSGTKLALRDIKRNMGTGTLSPDWMLKRGLEFDIKEIDRSTLVELGRAVDKGINDVFAVDPKVFERALSPLNKFLLEPANTLTWDYGHAAGKYLVAANTMAKMKARNPNMSWDAIAKEVIPYINDQFGGINWLGIAQEVNNRYAKAFAYWLYSRQGSPLMNAVMFAPDWTASTFRAYYKALPNNMLKRVFRPNTWEFKETAKALKNPKTHQDLARLYALKNALMWVTLLEGINLATSNHHIWENKDPTRIDLGDGTTMQLAKHSMEAVHWIRDPMKTLGNKLSPAIKAPYILATGKAYPAIDAPMVAGRDLPSRVAGAASQFLPFQVNEIIKAPPGEKAKRAIASMLGAPIYGTTSKQFTSPEVQQERKVQRKESTVKNKLEKAKR